MTRKKSNVKALALAVTCAILTGGYSGLNPVYAAGDYGDYTVKYDATHNSLDYVTQNSAGGYNTYGIYKIKLNNIVLDSSIGASPMITVGSYFSIDGSNGSISAANGKFEVSGTGAITASSLKLTGTNAVEDVGEAINTNTNNIAINTTNIQSLDGKIDTVNTNIRSDMAAELGKLDAKKVDTSAFGAYRASNDAAVNELKNKTQNIRVDTDTMVTSSDATYIDGITHAGGVRLADNGVRAEELVLKEGSAQATLTREGLAALNSMVYDANDKINNDTDGKPIIQAGNGSVVGGVTLDSGNITGVQNATVGGTLKVDNIKSLDGHNEITVADMATTKYNTDKISYDANDGTTIAGDVMVNKGAPNQVKINSEGIVVGLNSTVVGSDGVYAGGHNYNDAKAAIDGIDGKIKGAGGKFGVDDQGNVTTTGDIKGKDITVDGKLSANGDAVVGGDLSVAGKANFTQEATFAGGITTDAINEATADKGVTIDGVLLKDKGISAAGGNFTVDGATGNVKTAGDIEGQNIKANGALKGASLDVTNDAAVGGKLDVTGDTTLKGKLEVNGDTTLKGNLAVDKNIKGQSLNIGATGTEFTVDTVGKMTSKSANIGSVGITDTGVITGVTSLTTDALTVTGAFTTGGNLTVTGDLSASGAIKGKTISITDGGSIAGVSFATGGNLTATTGTIAGVSFAAGGDVSGVHDLTASGTIQGATLKVNDNNLLDNNGLKADKAVIDSVVIDDASITSTGANGLDVENVNLNNGAITANSATIGGVNTLDNTGINVATGSRIQVGVNTVIEDGSIAVSTNTKLTDQALNLNATNTWTAAGGLVADKAAINGVTIGETAGKAVFNNAGKATTIDGDTIQTGKITADELLIDKISLGKNGSSNISIDKDGHVQTKGDIKITDAAGNVMSKLSQDQAIFGKDAENQTTINNGKLKAKAKDGANQQAEFNFDENGLTVSGLNAAGATSSFGFNAATGIGTFTGQDGTTTAINGSNLTLTNGTNSTALTAGGATFTGAAGEKGGTQTIINGGTISTDTLNVERINLGGEVIDKGAAGVEANSKLYMDAQGNFRAAGGNFKVNGADGAMTNTVGNTTLKTYTDGASMSYDNTAATGGVKSNVSVGNNNANVSAGAGSIDVTNESITSKVTDNASSTITKDSIVDKVGGTTIETKDGSFSVKGNAGNGMNINTNTGETTFTGAAGEKGSKTTTINGGNITTDTLNVERINLGGEMVDKTGATFGGNLSMDAQGNFSAAGGNFKVNGADGAMTNTVGKTSFATSDDGVNSSVTQDATHKSEFKQGLTSIGGVVTNGIVKIEQTLDGDNGNITNKVTDKDGKSSTLVQNGTGLEYTDSANAGNATRINSSDVSIGSATDDSKRINLSDLGQIDDLDGELEARDEYQNNKTAVGAINAEAGIRREEVARLDNRIDDVNNRVDKVGAMAAAIASLKSIGYDPQAPSEFSIGLGQYKGETGVAMGFFHYPNKNFMINVSLSTAGGETMGGIGATWRFGHKSPQKLLDEQREAQAKKELAAAEKYQAAAKLAKEAQERAEYAAKLARQAQVSADNAKAAADATQAKHFQ
ncbi:YadA C-terminal domain-containing protein [Phascolarctobacterium sp.]|uniref:YadA C-terminal domain-containing protein n=1 Tax=Phascolarctobacterium sp. TaxID=2049039 RepID=UPI0025E82161|nr:YadA C-terminal domain-containing protein [Phascolarctobacterium sp.]